MSRSDQKNDLGASVALVLSSTTLDRGDPLPPLPRRGRDCLARYRGVWGLRFWAGRREVETVASRSLRGLEVGRVDDQAFRVRV